MVKEHYEPTKEEMAKAEESMTESKNEMSWDRKRSIESLEKLGIHGHLERRRRERRSDGDGVQCTISGELENHTIELSWVYVGLREGRGMMSASDYGLHPERERKDMMRSPKAVKVYEDFQGKYDGLELSERNAEQLVRFYEKYATNADNVDREYQKIAELARDEEDKRIKDQEEKRFQEELENPWIAKRRQRREKHRQIGLEEANTSTGIMAELLPKESKTPETGAKEGAG